MNNILDISIVIPSYNRGDMVAQNLAKCLALSPGAKEVILVDDHSCLESENILRKLDEEHPRVKYIRLQENGGQAVARSIGMATASGKYVVSLDDDSWFLEADGLQRVWDRMESLPNCGILALAAYSHCDPVAPAQEKLTYVADHITCGAAYRTDVLRRIGYHLAFLRFEGEESDLSLKTIGRGKDIVLDQSIRVFHDYDPTKRPKKTLNRVRQFGVRNDLLRSIVYFPFPRNVFILAGRAISHFIFGVKHRYLWVTLRGYLGFIWLLPLALRKRNSIGSNATKRYFQLRRKPDVFHP